MSMNYVDEYVGDGVRTFVAWTIDMAEGGDLDVKHRRIRYYCMVIRYGATFLTLVLGGTSRGLTSGNRDTSQHVFVMRAVDDPKR